MGPGIEIDVAKRLGAFELRVEFSSASGLTAFFGRSGAGKTSLVNVLAGLERPDEGRIAVDGVELFNSRTNVDVPPARRRVGYVFQDGRLFPHMNVRANLSYGLRFVAEQDRHQDFDRIVDLLGISQLLGRKPATLSGGEKQRVAIGRALLASPRLLLMDEPLASLDAARKSEILPYIENLRDGLQIPIVYVSHAMEEVIRLADTLVILDSGHAVASGGVEEIMSRLDLRPLTGRYEAGAVLTVKVASHDPEFGLTALDFGAGTLIVPRLDLDVGTPIRVRIRARDVSLSRKRPEGTSILNIFEGKILEIAAGEGPQAEILLDIGTRVIARVTRKSISALALAPGETVFALVKAAAIDRHNMGLAGTRKRMER